MSFKSWFPSFTQPRRYPVRNLAHRRQRMIVEELESRLAPATFAQTGNLLNLDLNVANKSVSIVSGGTSYTLTLTGDTWTGTDSANVSGNGTNVLTVTSAGLAAIDTVNLTDSAAGAGVAFANSGANAYSDNFSITLDSGPTSAIQFTGSSSFTLANSLNVTTTNNVAFASGSSLTMATGAVVLSANSLSLSGAVQGNEVTFNVVNVTSTAGSTITTGTGLTVNNTGAASTLAGSISGAGAVTKSGGGTLIFSGTKTYSGVTTIDSGNTLKLGGSNATSPNSTISGAGTLDLNGFTTVIGGLQGATITNNATASAVVFATITTTFDGTIQDGPTGRTGVSVSGPSGTTLTMAGTNSYSGTTTIGPAITLKAGSTNGTSANSVVGFSGPGTFDLNGFNTTVAGLIGPTGTVTNNGATPAALTVSGNNGGGIGSKIIDGTSTTAVTVVGTLVTMTPAGSTYSGATTINSGNTLKLVGSGATSPNSTISGAGTLDLNGVGNGIGGLQGATITNNATASAVVFATITTTFDGTIQDGPTGRTGVSVSGPSGTTLTMAGTNSYSGTTTIGPAITLKAGSTNGTSANSVVGFSGPGTFDLNGFNTTVAGLIGPTGTVTNNGATPAALTVSGNNGGGIGSKIIDGTSTTAVTVVGTLVTMTPAGSTYSGATTINSGNTLKLVGSGATSPNSTISGAGTLDLNGFTTVIGGLQGATITNNATASAVVFATITTTFDGTIQDGPTGRTGVSVSGPSGTTLTMAGTNSYSGTTTIGPAITLKAGSTNGTSANSVVGFSGPGTFDLNGFNTTVAGLIGPTGTVTNNGATPAALTVSGNNGGGIGSKIIDGTSTTAVTVVGTLVTMTPAGSTYSGATTINSGNTLKLVGSGATSPNSTISGAGTLDLNGVGNGIGGLQGATITNNATASAVVFATITTTFDGTIQDGPTGRTGVSVSGPSGTTLTMAGTNSYSGTTTIGPAITLKAGSTNGTSANSVVGFSGPGTFDLNGFNTTVAGLIGPTGTVTNNGATPAALTVSGNNGGGIGSKIIDGTSTTAVTVVGTLVTMTPAGSTYSGATTINSGNTLKLVGSGATSPNSTISGAGTLDLNGVGNGIGGLQGATITNNATASAVVFATITTTFDGTIQDGPTGRTGVSVSGPSGTTLTMAGTNSYSGTTTIGPAITLKAGSTNGTSANSIISFSGSGTFDLNGFNTAVAGLVGSGSVALGNETLTVNSTTSTTYNGIMSGSGGLTKVGAAAFTLAGASAYSGTTTISAGTLQIGVGGPAGSLGTGDVINNAALVFKSSSNSTVSGIISGSGTLAQSGNGTTILTGANTYTGTTAVTAGTLRVDGSLADGPAAIDLTVASGAILGGSGTVAGTILVPSGGSLAPGASPGILQTGDVAFSSGANFNVDLNGTILGTQYDQLSSTGAVDLGNANLHLTLGFTPTFGNVFTIVTAANLTGTFNDLADGDSTNIGGREFRVNYTAAAATLTDITNTPPVTAADAASVSANEGSTATNTGTFADAQGNSTVTISASIGTVTQDNTNGTWSWSLAAADGPAGPFTVTITATDDRGAAANATFTYSIDNVAPTISLSGNATVDEGSPYTLNLGVITDPGQDTVTSYSINWGDGVIDTFLGNPANTTATHKFADGPSNQLNQVTVTDEDGVFLAGSLSVQVLNVAPVITNAQVDHATINMGETVTLSSTFTDPGPLDTHTVVINWGDGSASTTLSLLANVLTFSVTHQYVNTQAGNPPDTISLTVTDKDGASDVDTATVTVLTSVYVLNPNASGALTLSGNANIHVAGLVDVDSNSASALQASGNASISADSIKVTGGVQTSGNATLSTTSTGAAVAPDPLAFLTAPTLADLGLTSMPTPISVNLSGNSTMTINPGVYSQIKVSGNAHLILNPGIYVLAGGGLTVTGNGGITGNGVMLYNAGSNYVSSSGTPTYGGLTLSGNGTIQLTAPAVGKFAGILVFQSRDNTRAISLSGNALAMQGGAVYAQQALLVVSGNADIQASLVVNQLQLTGNAASALTADDGLSFGNTAGQLLAGDLVLYVDNSAGQFTSAELDRIADAIDAINIVINPFGVAISEVDQADRQWATTVLQISSTSAVGGALDGVLGCESPGNITLVSGWDWYASADSSAVGAGQYDFQTIVTHELGHALGLGHSTDSSSVMYATLNRGEAHRVLSTADLAIPDVGAVACGLHAANGNPSELQSVNPPNGASVATVATPPFADGVLQDRSIWDSIATPQPFAPTRGTYLLPMENLNAAREAALIHWLGNAVYHDDAKTATSDWGLIETRDVHEIPINVFIGDADAGTDTSLIDEGTTTSDVRSA